MWVETIFFFLFFRLTLNENKNCIRLTEYDLFYTEVKILVQTIWNFYAYIPHPHHYIIWMNYVSQTSNGGGGISFSYCLSNLLSITNVGTCNSSNILNGNSSKLCKVCLSPYEDSHTITDQTILKELLPFLGISSRRFWGGDTLDLVFVFLCKTNLELL